MPTGRAECGTQPQTRGGPCLQSPRSSQQAWDPPPPHRREAGSPLCESQLVCEVRMSAQLRKLWVTLGNSPWGCISV